MPIIATTSVTSSPPQSDVSTGCSPKSKLEDEVDQDQPGGRADDRAETILAGARIQPVGDQRNDREDDRHDAGDAEHERSERQRTAAEWRAENRLTSESSAASPRTAAAKEASR